MPWKGLPELMWAWPFCIIGTNSWGKHPQHCKYGCIYLGFWHQLAFISLRYLPACLSLLWGWYRVGAFIFWCNINKQYCYLRITFILTLCYPWHPPGCNTSSWHLQLLFPMPSTWPAPPVSLSIQQMVLLITPMSYWSPSSMYAHGWWECDISVQ